MSPNDPGLFHNRMSHSLEVARIGRAVAMNLLERAGGRDAAGAAGGLDPAVVEAACLAHDLGHPPFGHDAEDELDRLLTATGVADGFEANAQSFRVVCTLATDESGNGGLNLTRATLAAILKYPWKRNGSPANPRKWGSYESEVEDLTWARALMPPDSQEPTLEASIMDWADLVAYAVRDFEDFTRAGLIPLDWLRADVGERERFLSLVCARRRIPAAERETLATTFERLLTVCPVMRSSPSARADRHALLCFANHQINDAISAMAISERGSDAGALVIDPATKSTILLLEGLTWHYVIDGDLLKAQREGQRELIRVLFESLAEAASSEENQDLFPATDRERFQAAGSESARLRVVADVIASMSEEQVIELCG
jgi:dGTPase